MAQMKEFREQKRQIMLGIDPNKKKMKNKGPVGSVPVKATSAKVILKNKPKLDL